MTPLQLTTSITAIANAIACSISDDDSLALLAATFTQLGDTLATISLQRSICDKLDSNGNNSDTNNNVENNSDIVLK